MELLSIWLPLITKNDPLLEIIIQNIKDQGKSLNEGDIIVIAEKVVATSQGRVISLSASMILGGMRHVILAKVNDFLIANAGIDQSNAGIGNVVLLPKDLKKVVWKYWRELREEFGINDLGVIIADSRVQPLRKGTIGIAIATAGFEPVEDLRGHPDLFNRPMEITMRAIADDLASAAQFLLSEADQQTPVVIIRGSNVGFTENPLLTPEMAPEECLYMNIFSKYLLKKHQEK